MSDSSTQQPYPAVSLTPAEIRRVAAEAGVEPRTAAKFLRGERVVSTCADRIRRALMTLSIGDRRGPSCL